MSAAAAPRPSLPPASRAFAKEISMQKKQPTWLGHALAGAALTVAPGAAHAEKVTIKLGTLAPEGRVCP